MLRIWWCDCALCGVGNEFPMPPTTQSHRHPLTRAHHIAPRIKTARRSRRKTPGDKMNSWKEVVSNFPTILHGRDAILRVRDKLLISNMILQLWADVKYHVPTGLVFRRRRAVLILLAMPPTSLGRAALGLWCGRFKPRLEIRHAAALTTGAKHWHRQKAVFFMFLFQFLPVFIH